MIILLGTDSEWLCYDESHDDQTAADSRALRPWTDQRHLEENGDVFLPKDRALSVLNKRGAYQGRITCECCQYQCTFHELSQYCSVTAIKRSASRIGLGSIIRQSPSSEKESADIRDKQLIGRLLRKFGPQWLEDYLQYPNV
ncbi:hypothetical protein LSH36_100g03017 [Paralvinella palmiformis]|uniref:Uncharacterized protein n=1 Tax=Paralvinella palmiformis TaxID=53620 RepID=A0AAD9NBQ5_9ANNE|nr:hypothetical protein LSH36_100g03017 [Paralvinella palmiformis]